MIEFELCKPENKLNFLFSGCFVIKTARKDCFVLNSISYIKHEKLENKLRIFLDMANKPENELKSEIGTRIRTQRGFKAFEELCCG
jgi:hypothetical protein